MLTPVEVPKLTLAMESGKVVKWFKVEGDRVETGEDLFELETDKAATEVTAPASGILGKIAVAEGEVACGAIVAWIGEATDDFSRVSAPELPKGEPSPVALAGAPALHPARPGAKAATPAARRRARELNVDIQRIEGTGPGGRIVQEDVEKAAQAKKPDDLRFVIAEKTARAWRDVPHIHIGGDLRAAGLESALEKAKTSLGPQITVTDLLLFAIASALPSFADLNAVWTESGVSRQTAVHCGFAVHTGRGVVVPVVRDAEKKSLTEISAERKRLSLAAKGGKLKPSEVEGGTFTLSNLGMYPVDFFAPIVNHPQVAILATGRIRDRLELQGQKVTAAPYMWANVALDHRVVDGAVGAEFLRALEETFDSLHRRI